MLSVDFNSEEYWIQEFWQYIISGRILAFHADIPEDALFESLFVLEIQWLSNQGSFADTLATCMPLHQISFYSSNSLKSFMCLQIELCELIAHVVGSAAVASVNEEDFSINLYGITSRNRLVLKGAKVLVDSFQYNPYYRRLKLWKQFWDIIAEIITNTTSNVADQIMLAKNIISDLSLKSPTVSESYSSIKPESIGIFPVMSNVFGSGCPRRPIPKVTIHEAWERWYSILKDLLQVFSLASSLCDSTKSINMMVKNQRLAENETLKGIIALQGLEGISAIPRSILFTILLSALRQAANDTYLDVIQILCHSHARQHRLIPKFMKKYIDSPQVNQFIVPLTIWHVLLGFRLDLYNQQEVFEALWIILKLSEDSSLRRFSGRVSAILKASEDPTESAVAVSVYDDCRFSHRWECPLATLHWLHQEHMQLSSADCNNHLQCINDRGSKFWRFPHNFHLWKELFEAFLSNGI